MHKIFQKIFLLTVLINQHDLFASEPPRQILPTEIVPSSNIREHVQKVSDTEYTFNKTFLMKSALVVIAGIACVATGEYARLHSENCDESETNCRRNRNAVFPSVLGIKLLCVGCGGCLAFWQERCCDQKHHID